MAKKKNEHVEVELSPAMEKFTKCVVGVLDAIDKKNDIKVGLQSMALVGSVTEMLGIDIDNPSDKDVDFKDFDIPLEVIKRIPQKHYSLMVATYIEKVLNEYKPTT